MARKVGNYGEELAVEFLQKNGYQILKRQYRTRYSEIDIIARHDDCHGNCHDEYIVFIEVKYRRSLRFGYPRESVNLAKQKKIKQNALIYMANELKAEHNFRFDVIEIVDDGVVNITHIKNAF